MNGFRWFYGWNIVGLTLVCQILTVGLPNFCFALLAMTWQQEFDAPRRDVMLAMTLQVFGAGLLSALCGKWIDRIPVQRLLCGGAALFALGLAAVAYARSMWQINLVFALLLPFGSVLAGPHLCQALVGRWFVENRGLALGISVLGTSLGGFILPPVVVRAFDALGWRHTFLAAAIFTLVVLIPLAYLILRRKPDTGSHTAAATHAELTTIGLLTNPRFWLVVAAFMPILMAFYAVHANLGSYAKDIGFTPAQVATVISVVSLSMVAGKIAFGRLIDRVDHRHVYFVVIGLLVAGIAGISLPGGYGMLMAGAVGVGLAMGGTMPLMSVRVMDCFGAHTFGQVMGLLFIFINISAVGPVVAGWVRDATGSYPLVFLAFLAPLVPAVIWMSLSPSTRQPAAAAG